MPSQPLPPLPDVVSLLAEKISQCEGRRPPLAAEQVSTGCPALDHLLPARGLRRGTLVEWLAARAGSGAGAWAVMAAGQACRDGGAVVVVDRRGSFYAPAAVGWGLELEKLIVVRPRTRAEEEWAWDQILRARPVAALLAWPERLDDRTFRRLQLAAQESGALGLLIRPAAARGEPSWADVRLLVEPLAGGRSDRIGAARRFRIELLRARGGGEGRAIEALLEEERGVFHASKASPVRVVASLAAGASGRRSRGA
jgi:hypothetical protein